MSKYAEIDAEIIRALERSIFPMAEMVIEHEVREAMLNSGRDRLSTDVFRRRINAMVRRRSIVMRHRDALGFLSTYEVAK